MHIVRIIRYPGWTGSLLEKNRDIYEFVKKMLKLREAQC